MNARAKPGMTRSGASQHPITLLHLLRIQVNLPAHVLELLRHRGHSILDHARHRHPDATTGHRALVRIIQRRRIIPHVLRDLHRAELRPAHRAEMRDLVGVLRQRFVVVAARGFGIEAEVELVLPAEVEAGA
jgi:hypothetical protein